MSFSTTVKTFTPIHNRTAKVHEFERFVLGGSYKRMLSLFEVMLNQPDDLSVSLGKVLRLMRKTAKVSQTDFGKMLGVHQTAVCRIEKGSQSLTPVQLLTISKYFDVSIDSLLDG